MRGVVRALVRPVLGSRTPVRAQRWWLAAATRLTPPAEGVDVRAGELGGRPMEVLVPRDGDPGRTVLYLRGGGFTIGSPATHRALAAHLAAAVPATVHLLDYRLAPGDSAGGWLALAAALRLRDAKDPLPAALAGLPP